MAQLSEDFLRPESEYRSGLMLSPEEGRWPQREDCRGRVGQEPLFRAGLKASVHVLSP